jgi:hypothetical protein
VPFAPWPNSDCIRLRVCHEQGHGHYSEFISGLCFRIWSLIKCSQQMAVGMDLELLQAVVIPFIQASNWWSFIETVPDTVHTSRVQDHHSSLDALIYYLQFSVVHKDDMVPVSCISGIVWEVFMDSGTFNKIKTLNNYYLPAIVQKLLQF